MTLDIECIYTEQKKKYDESIRWRADRVTDLQTDRQNDTSSLFYR